MFCVLMAEKKISSADTAPPVVISHLRSTVVAAAKVTPKFSETIFRSGVPSRFTFEKLLLVEAAG